MHAAAGDPAREVVFEYIANSTRNVKLLAASVRIQSLSPSTVYALTISQAHFICSKDRSHAVHKGVDRVHETLHRLGMADAIGSPYPAMLKCAPGAIYALAAGCAGCETVVDSGAGLKCCSRCRMTRYCGTACQKRDWARHKGVCGKVHEVVFENWD